MNTASVALNNKKELVKYVSSERRLKENNGPILVEDGPVTNRTKEKLKIFSFFSPSALSKVRPQSQRTTTAGTVTLHLCTEILRGQLYHLTVQNIVRPGEVHPRILQELLDMRAGPHSKVMGVQRGPHWLEVGQSLQFRKVCWMTQETTDLWV